MHLAERQHAYTRTLYAHTHGVRVAFLAFSFTWDVHQNVKLAAASDSLHCAHNIVQVGWFGAVSKAGKRARSGKAPYRFRQYDVVSMCLPLMCVGSEGRLTGEFWCSLCPKSLLRWKHRSQRMSSTRARSHPRTCHQDLDCICTIGPDCRADKCVRQSGFSKVFARISLLPLRYCGVEWADGRGWQVEEDDDAEPFFLTLARKIPLCGNTIAEKLDPEAIS